MTIELYETKNDAELKAIHLKTAMPWTKNIPIKIRFDEKDHGHFGMRGFTFNAIHEKIYYILAESKDEAKSWGLHSKIL